MALIKSASKTARNKNIKTDDLSINWMGHQTPSQGLGRRWGEVREFTSRTRGGPRPARSRCSRRVHLWTRLEIAAGKPPKQAVAIGYAIQRKAKAKGKAS